MSTSLKKETRIIRRRLVRSYITSVISISLVLTLIGSAVIFWTNAGRIASFFKENVAVTLILADGLDEPSGKAFADSLRVSGCIKKTDYISAERGARELEDLLGKDFLSVFETTPIPSSVEVYLNGDSLSTEYLSSFSARMEEDSRVGEVVYQKSLVEALNANLRKITLVLTVVIAILLAISFALINNTVRLNIFARRFTIHTMKMVGAGNSFIRRPFVRQALLQGLVSGLLAASVIAFGVWYVSTESPLLFSLFDIKVVATALCGTVLLGMAICSISAFFVAGRIACSSKDELYF